MSDSVVINIHHCGVCSLILDGSEQSRCSTCSGCFKPYCSAHTSWYTNNKYRITEICSNCEAAPHIDLCDKCAFSCSSYVVCPICRHASCGSHRCYVSKCDKCKRLVCKDCLSHDDTICVQCRQ